jgi:predicted amidohydrolase
MQDLKILCLQTGIIPDNPEQNRELLGIKIRSHAEHHDLIVLPEAFTTGFHVDPEGNAEKADGETLAWMKKAASETGAVLTGSIFIEDAGKFTNSLIWMRPDGSYERYDKRHVFSMGGEDKQVSKGTSQLIVELKGWKIKPMICYDLRFPVWVKNTMENDTYAYDLALFVANWPEVRAYPWIQLLKARAIENLAYVVGVNRIGHDTTGTYYDGDSMIVDPKGKVLEHAGEGKERVLSATLNYEELRTFREKFNVGPDWDKFEINI